MIGEKIKGLRKAKNMTQEELSKMLKVSQPVLNRWETGSRNPSLKTLKKISDVFNISIDTLLLDHKDMKKLTIQDKTLLEKLQQIERLSDQEKEMVINLINALAQKKA